MKATETSWARVVDDFRRVCIARREERLDDANRLLREDLPRSIAEWSRESGSEGADKRAQLDRMFQHEQRRIDEAWVLHDLVSLRLTHEIVPAICARLGETVRETLANVTPAAPRATRPAVRLAPPRRVAFDDVAGVIDLLLGQEQSGRRATVTSCCT